MIDNDDNGGGEDEGRIFEWELGLPSTDDLTPLSQLLIPSQLASAFSISPEPRRSILEVNQASESTLSGLRGAFSQVLPSSDSLNFKSFAQEGGDESVIAEFDEDSSQRKTRRVENGEAVESSENFHDDSPEMSKRPRMVWTPQLHKRFVDVVDRLGLKNAVPKTIMQLMNVEGLTRENVASHLQKYRLYVKRIQHDGPSVSSSSDLFPTMGGSMNGHLPSPMHMSMPNPPSHMIPIHSGMPGVPIPYHGYESYHGHPFEMMQHKDWSGSKMASVASYHHLNHEK